MIAIGLAALPLLTGSGRAAVVTGYLDGTIGTISETNFLDAAGFSFNQGDTVDGSFSYDTANFAGTFTASLTDTITGETFIMPVGAVTSGSITPSPGAYAFTVTDSLISDPGQEDQTAYTTTLSLSLVGSLPILSGDGSFQVNIPQEGPYPAESANFPLEDVSAAIPEPVSMTVLGIGLAGLLASRRRVKG